MVFLNCLEPLLRLFLRWHMNMFKDGVWLKGFDDAEKTLNHQSAWCLFCLAIDFCDNTLIASWVLKTNQSNSCSLPTSPSLSNSLFLSKSSIQDYCLDVKVIGLMHSSQHHALRFNKCSQILSLNNSNVNREKRV